MNIDACRIELTAQDCPSEGRRHGRRITASQRGRWPANLLLSHGAGCTEEQCEADCPVGLLGDHHRFFYCAKTSRREREAGCEELPRRVVQTFKIGAHNKKMCAANPVANIHPTVKPIDADALARAARDPVPAGSCSTLSQESGSTGAAAVLEGARFLGIEREADLRPDRPRPDHALGTPGEAEAGAPSWVHGQARDSRRCEEIRQGALGR